jgi:hypothetical protein
LVIAGRGAGLSAGSSAAQAGNGCLFDTTLRPTFPLLQYGGGGTNDNFDDFSFKFIVIGGKTERLNLVSNIVGLFSDISAAARWASVTNALAGPVAGGVEKAASAFQTAMQSAGTLQNQVSANYILKAYAPGNGIDNNSVVIITIPQLFGDDGGNGNLVIYVRRYGSLVLANAGPVLKLETVFDNQELSNRQCNPVAIAQGSCNSTNNITPIRQALANLLQEVDPDTGGKGNGEKGPVGGNPPTPGANAPLAVNSPAPGADAPGGGKTPEPSNTNSVPTGIDPKDPVKSLIDINDPKRMKNTYAVCKGMRTVARTVLHLSTLDEMLIRWAFTAEAGLQDALDKKDDAWAKNLGAQSLAQLKAVCWNKGDAETLTAVLAGMNKKSDPVVVIPKEVTQPAKEAGAQDSGSK